MEYEDRIRSIERAESLILEAADIVEKCIRLTEEDRRFGKLPEKIRSLDTGSDGIANLLRQVRADEGDPLWTRPLASPKNNTRKDK